LPRVGAAANRVRVEVEQAVNGGFKYAVGELFVIRRLVERKAGERGCHGGNYTRIEKNE